MYLYAFANHQETVVDALSNKKLLLKKRVNRSDNFTNLTLLGVEKCLKERELPKETTLYIASNNGNMNSTMKILEAIFKQDRLPMPFNFLNSVNASILFFVAKNFGIEGKAIFSDTFESALTQAYVDVQNGKTVLVGNVSEAMINIALHKKRFNTNAVIEQSQWLLLSPKIEDKEAISHIDAFKLAQMTEENNMEMLFEFLESEEKRKEYFGENILFTIAKR